MVPSEMLSRAVNFLASCFSINILLGLVPAFLIAGGINVFVPQSWVTRYFGDRTNKLLSYGAATIAGVVISV